MEIYPYIWMDLEISFFRLLSIFCLIWFTFTTELTWSSCNEKCMIIMVMSSAHDYVKFRMSSNNYSSLIIIINIFLVMSIPVLILVSLKSPRHNVIGRFFFSLFIFPFVLPHLFFSCAILMKTRKIKMMNNMMINMKIMLSLSEDNGQDEEDEIFVFFLFILLVNPNNKII